MLIGLTPVDPAQRFTAGSHLFRKGAAQVASESQGHVTSVAYSGVLDRWIALGLLEHGPGRIGEIIVAASPVRGTRIAVEVCSPVFFDARGERLRARSAFRFRILLPGPR